MGRKPSVFTTAVENPTPEVFHRNLGIPPNVFTIYLLNPKPQNFRWVSRCEDYMGDSDMRRVMGVLIHGDAAFCGQVA